MHSPDEHVQRLHDRASRGEALNPEEQKQLDTWYAARDAEESQTLGLPETADAAVAEPQIRSTLIRIAETAQRIQEIASENDRLRREIATLHLELSRRSSPQQA